MAKTQGVLAIIAGAGAIYGTPNDVEPAVRIALKTLGGIAIGYGVYELFFAHGGLLGDVQGALASSAAVSGSAFEDVLGAIGRATGNETPVGVTTSSDRGAEDGPYFGTPKNVLLVAGVIRAPMEGGSVTVPIFSDTIRVDAALENQSKEMRAGIIQARTIVEGEEPIYTTGGRIELQPGEMKSVQMNVPYRHVGFTAFKKHTVALIFANYKLAEVNFSIDRSFF